MKYFVKVGNREMELTVDGETVTVDGTQVRAHLEDLTGTPQQILSIGDEVHRVLARRGDRRGQYDLSIGGYRFATEALDERARAIRELSGSAAAQAGPAHLVAPMPGLIVRVNVQEGDRVRQGQGLVVMEAMKMENELKASSAGIVRRVVVGAGSAVEKGTVLLELDSGDNA